MYRINNRGPRIDLYADDTALFYASDNPIELSMTLRIELDSVGHWLHANRLTLNTAKTKFIIFGSRYKLSQLGEFALGILGEPIERVYSFKYLGVLLDEFLSFNEHIDYLLNKANKKLGILRKVRKCLNKSLSLTLYKSLVLPHFDYCDIVYMCTSQENLHKLQLVQNSVCRTLLLAESDRHISDMHRELKLDQLEVRRDCHLSHLCHQNIYFNGLVSLSDFFVQSYLSWEEPQELRQHML